MELPDKTIRFVVFIGALATVIIATGPGLFGISGYESWINSWQISLFNGTCHQLPHRSFFLNGIPMAVCSRCYGFYWGLFAGLPVSGIIPVRFHIKKVALIVLISSLGLIAADVIIEVAGLWQNTLTSRFITGLLLGGSLYSAIFFTK